MYDGKYDMWLSRVPGVTIRKFDALVGVIGSAEGVWNATPGELRDTGVLDAQTAYEITGAQNDALMDSYLREMEAKSIRFVSRFAPDFPEYLDDIPSCPIGLYVLGSLPGNDVIKLSVIGSRKCSEYGLTVSQRISYGLAAHGIVVVSGMARGIDSQAHKGALAAGGLTIAVLGGGVDMCYPPENRTLKERIVQNGAVVSEYPPGVHPMPAYFPIRNRIISGLSRAVIVVEAARKSGTIITVDQALNQGREVFAVPGNITSKLSQGTNDYIRQGAALITCFEDVLDNLGIEYDESEPASESAATKRRALSLAGDEKAVYDCLAGNPPDVDAISAKTGLPVQKVNAVLLLLEMDGLVKKLPGWRYSRS